MLAACGGGGGPDHAAPAPTSTRAAPATTPPPPTIDLSRPIPGGSLHGTPRPPLENTGDDYVTIFKSLDATYRWLTENPDPQVISDVYLPGTAEHDAGVQNFSRMVERGWRAADEGYRLVNVEVKGAAEGIASLRVVDEFDRERFVDVNGDQVGEGRAHDGPSEWLVLLARDAARLWRIADWAPATEPVAVR